MSRRTLVEVGLLVVGVGIGAWAVGSPKASPSTPEEAPTVVTGVRPETVTAAWPVSRGTQGLTGACAERLPDAVAVAWAYRTGAPILSSPVVADGRVFVGSNDNRVHAVDAATGTPLWTYPTPDDVEAPPLAIDGRVFVGSADGTLHAIDAASGEGLWTYATDDRILGGANYARTADGRTLVLVGSYDRKLHGVDAATGQGVWSVKTENYVNGTPAVFEDVVVFGGCDGILHVVDAESGETRRDVPLGDDVYVASSVAVDLGTAYVAHVDNACVAVAIRSGKVEWTYRAEDGYFSSPALAADRVLVGGRDRFLRALDRTNGAVLWSYACRAALDSSPVIAGDRVVVGSEDGRIYAVDLESGTSIWEHSLGGAITAAVAVAGGLIFVGCEDGTLYALGARP